MDHTKRNHIQIGMWVDIVLKKDQPTGILTRGQVGRILTNKAQHSRGIKVQLTDGQVGRIQKILSKEEIKQEIEAFYQRFFTLPAIYSLFFIPTQQFLVFRYQHPQTNIMERTALLFDNELDLKYFILGTSYYQEDYMIKPIPLNESIVNHFLPQYVEYFRINGTRKISIDSFQELESRYRRTKDFLSS